MLCFGGESSRVQSLEQEVSYLHAMLAKEQRMRQAVLEQLRREREANALLEAEIVHAAQAAQEMGDSLCLFFGPHFQNGGQAQCYTQDQQPAARRQGDGQGSPDTVAHDQCRSSASVPGDKAAAARDAAVGASMPLHQQMLEVAEQLKGFAACQHSASPGASEASEGPLSLPPLPPQQPPLSFSSLQQSALAAAAAALAAQSSELADGTEQQVAGSGAANAQREPRQHSLRSSFAVQALQPAHCTPSATCMGGGPSWVMEQPAASASPRAWASDSSTLEADGSAVALLQPPPRLWCMQPQQQAAGGRQPAAPQPWQQDRGLAFTAAAAAAARSYQGYQPAGVARRLQPSASLQCGGRGVSVADSAALSCLAPLHWHQPNLGSSRPSFRASLACASAEAAKSLAEQGQLQPRRLWYG